MAALLLLTLKAAASFLLVHLPLIGDERSYWVNSEQFFARYWQRGDWWPPLQTAFLAVMRLLAGERGPPLARLVQLAVQTLTAAMLVVLGARLGSRTGLASGLLYLALPEAVAMAYLLFSETWCLFWLVGAILLLDTGMERDDLSLSASAGLALGVASMFRSVCFYLAVPLALLLALRFPLGRARRAAAALAFAAAAWLPVGVQVAKNYRVFGEFLPLDVSMAHNFWVSHNTFEAPVPDLHKPYYGDEVLEQAPGARPRVRSKGGPAAHQRAEMVQALRFIAAHPLLTLVRVPRKLGALFDPSFFMFRNLAGLPAGSRLKPWLHNPFVRLAGALSVMVTVLLATAGLFFSPRSRTKQVLLVVLAYFLAVYAFFYGFSRYRLTLVPILTVFAAWSLANWRESAALVKSRKGWPVITVWALLLTGWIPAMARIVP